MFLALALEVTLLLMSLIQRRVQKRIIGPTELLKVIFLKKMQMLLIVLVMIYAAHVLTTLQRFKAIKIKPTTQMW